MAKARRKLSTKVAAGTGGRFPVCAGFRVLEDDQKYVAAETAVKVNPANAPREEIVASTMAAFTVPDVDVAKPSDKQMIAVMTTKYWGKDGVDLTVGFMQQTSVAMREKVLAYMNKWGVEGRGVNVRFRWTQTSPQVRISFGGGGYWSYLGTDILHVPGNQQTMNLQGFTVNTPDSEWERVVTHETGHTLGFPHEHLRRELVDRLDENKTIAYFKATQGWSESTTRSNVLVPLEEASLMGTPHADETSIMAYQLPGSITKDGRPIAGGTRINDLDYTFVAQFYPVKSGPVVPPTGAGTKLIIEFNGPVPTVKSYRIE